MSSNPPGPAIFIATQTNIYGMWCVCGCVGICMHTHACVCVSVCCNCVCTVCAYLCKHLYACYHVYKHVCGDQRITSVISP